MKDSYSLDKDWEGLDKQYRAHYQAYFNIFHRCGLPVMAVKSDVGMMGGKMAHEFMYLTPIGEDTLLICDDCYYSANRQIATFQKNAPSEEKVLPIEKIATPKSKTIEALSESLNIPHSKTAKAVFIIAKVSDERQKEQEQFVIAIVRGDMEVNETKLANALKAKELRPATEEEILSAGTVPGYASPVNLKNVLVIVDDVIPKSPNLVAGANEDGFHFCNVNYGRDYSANIVTDIAAAQEGDHCPNCGSPMRSVRGVEVGNIFKLGTRYSDAVGCTFLDKDGKEKSVIMGSYGIGSGRLFACVAEEHNDNDGLLWPITIAPYHVHLVTIGENENVTNIAMELYYNLQKADIEVFFDDRKEKPGVKFKDADLIGLPIRLTVSPRSLDKNGVELKLRYSKEQVIVELSQVVSKVNSEIQLMKMEISNREIKINFDQQQ